MGARAAVAQLPMEPGVYRFLDASGRVLYLGRASTLRSRVASYWSDLRDRRHLVPMVRRIASVQAVVCASVHEAAWLERNLLEADLPRWNRTPGGQEKAVLLALDARPPAPALTVEHERRLVDGVRYFGPYLGGLRARLAVAALGRVLPLAYAVTASSGTHREFARLRGVSGADRAALAGSIAAVLDRDPAAVAAVRDKLSAMRDGASEQLAFELAGRIRDEIEALDWVTSTQRVTVLDGGDAEICGWVDGASVRFTIRAGRMRSWSQERCPGPDPLAAASPERWREFARRNAKLAAALAVC